MDTYICIHNRLNMEVDKYDWSTWTKENFVASGGAARVVSYIGAVEKLEECGRLAGFKRFAGSSAGSICASVLSFRAPVKKVRDILLGLDFKALLDDDIGIVRDSIRFIKDYGFYKGDALEDWIESILKELTGDADITFAQAHAKYGTELVITGTNLSRRITEFYHYKTFPDMKISKAIRISCSIPFVFKAVKRPYTANGITYDEVLVDGGVLNNYPVWVFNKDGSLCESRVHAMPNENTIGLQIFYGNTDGQFRNLKNIEKYARGLIDSLFSEIHRGHVTSDYWQNTVSVVIDFATDDIKVSLDQKLAMIECGRKCMTQFLEKYKIRS